MKHKTKIRRQRRALRNALRRVEQAEPIRQRCEDRFRQWLSASSAPLR